MTKEDARYSTYIDILKEELVPAMGCTEPISLAYAGAIAREVLGELPVKVVIEASGSLIKNVKSVIVPNTGHMKGIEAATAAGIVAGNASKKLEVLSDINDEQRTEIENFLSKTEFEVLHIENGPVFELAVTIYSPDHEVSVRIVDTHTNVVLVKKDGKILKQNDLPFEEVDSSNRSSLTLAGILDFAESVDIEDVKSTLDRQILYNTAICEEGLLSRYGANIGSVLLKNYGNDIHTRAKARAAAGSDARMNGCELPVIINSGSGNQGITCSIPVIEYAKELKAGREKLYRALVISNLTAIHQKAGIGTLSAYCGAVSAAAGAGAGIAYLYGGDLNAISDTVVNALAIVSGIVCDGAKASCAAKIASAVDAAILGYHMVAEGEKFNSGDGIVLDSAEKTIEGIGKIGKDGMRETNEEIIKIMIGQ